jgi:putative ABC transport system permease protein
VITRSKATELGLGTGGTINATLADGTSASLLISGVVPDGSAPAELLLDRRTVRSHDPSALASVVPVPEAYVGHLSSGDAAVGARVVDLATWARQADSEEDRLVWIFTLLLIGVSVGSGALAVANTLLMATARRAPDYRQLRLVGATPRQVLKAVAAESALVVAIGSALGGVAALFGLWGSVQGLRAQTGTSVGLTVPWPAAGAAVAACLLLAVLASVLPARARLRDGKD